MIPPDGVLDIGGGHRIVFVEYRGETAGINDWHLKPDGAWCHGWVAFKGAAWDRQFVSNPIESWDVVQREPLTLSPSIACRACGDHGFIQQGKWAKA